MNDDIGIAVGADKVSKAVDGPDGRLVILDDVSLALARGDSLAIVGESGSGKTTLARVIAGADTATAGDVLLDGARLTAERSPSQRRAIQLVSQNHRAALNRRRSVRHAPQNSAEPGQARRLGPQVMGQGKQ